MRERITLAHAGMGGVLVYRGGEAGYTLLYTGDKEHSNKDLTKILPRYTVPAR